jgi:hypothetical protein
LLSDRSLTTRHSIASGRCLSVLQALAALAAVAAPAAAQIVFEPPVSTPLTHKTQGVLSADVNLDGHADLITLPRFELAFVQPKFSVLLGQGDGTFAAPITTPINTQAADGGRVVFLNGDAFPDLLFSYNQQIEGESLLGLIGGGDGTFSVGLSLAVPSINIVDQVPADLNGDGHRDYLVLDAGIGSFGAAGHLLAVVSVSATSYTTKNAANLQNGSEHFAVADLDGDSVLDVVATNTLSGSLSIVLGTGGGNFAAPVHVAVGGQPVGLVLADLDGDALLDLVFADSAGNRVVSMLGDGEGHFAQVQSLTVPGGPGELSAGALDPRDTLDLLVSLAGTDELAMLRGAGDGTFSHVATLSHVTDPSRSALADFDEDGVLDGAVGTSTAPTGAVIVARNATYPAGSPFTDLGHAKKGTNGFPIQLADGTLQVGTPLAFALTNGLPLGNTSLVLGFSQINAPFKGGVMVPAVDVLITPLPMDATGTVTLVSLWPPAIPSGFTFYLQFWFKDAGALLNEAGSSGLRVVTP